MDSEIHQSVFSSVIVGGALPGGKAVGVWNKWLKSNDMCGGVSVPHVVSRCGAQLRTQTTLRLSSGVQFDVIWLVHKIKSEKWFNPIY
jgi:hypothetical protein